MRVLSLAVIILASSAQAHFRLIYPTDWLDAGTSPYADPIGGDQKTPPCGDGTAPTGAVTTLQAGSQLTVKWAETVAHPGWYRISLARSRSTFLPGDATLNCTDGGFEHTPEYPVLADGINQHSSAMNTFAVTVPNGNCDNCTVQVTEFMLNHGGNCFYWHCANVKIVGSDAGELADDGGILITVDAGTGGGAGGGSGSGGGSGATGGGAGSSGGGTSSSSGGGSSASGGGTSSGTGGGSAATGGGSGSATGGGTSSATGGGNEQQQGGCNSVPVDAVFGLAGLLLILRKRKSRAPVGF